MHAFVKQSRTIAATLAVTAVLGCSSSSSTGPGGGTGPTGCTITLTGAISATPTCSGVTGVLTTDDNLFVFGFFSLDSTTSVVVSLGKTGAPSTTTYHSSDGGITGEAEVSTATEGWLAQTADTSSATAAAGSFSLTITSMSTITSAADGTVYSLHGSYTATLPAALTGTTGTVTMTVTF